MFVQQRSEASLDRLDLCLFGFVALGQFEQGFDLVFTVFALSAGLVV